MPDMPLIDCTLCSILTINVDKIKAGDRIKYHTDKTMKITVVFQMMLRPETIAYVLTTEGDIDALYKVIKNQVDNRYGVHDAWNRRTDLETIMQELGWLLKLHVKLGEIIYANVQRYGDLKSGWYKRMVAPKAHLEEVA
jgi:hypothetical protein